MPGQMLDEALRVLGISRLEYRFSARDLLNSPTSVHRLRSEQRDPAVMMLGVVPGEEALTELLSLCLAAETRRKGRTVFQGLELRLRVGVVVGHMRTAMGLGHAQVHQVLLHDFTGHCTASIRMGGELAGRNLLPQAGVQNELLGDLGALIGSQTPSDGIAAVDNRRVAS